MSPEKKDLILFPTWRKKLEEEVYLNMKQRNFVSALDKINILIEFNVTHHDVLFGKLICLMELGEYEEAKKLSKSLMNHKSIHYYQYLHVYLTALFQMNQYLLVIEETEVHLQEKDIPKEFQEPLRQLYNLSKELYTDIIKKESQEYYIALSQAFKDQNYQQQWQLLQKLRSMNVNPTDQTIAYLEDKTVHPVIKTTILKWLRDRESLTPVKIKKRGCHCNVVPANTKQIRSQKSYQDIIGTLSRVEQNNPSLYILLEQMLYRYMYVRYPFEPKGLEVSSLGKGFKYLGYRYLQLPEDYDLNKEEQEMVQDIHAYEQLYLSIIEE